MALFEWDDKYSVGVEEMDEHHKKLMDIINRLHDAMKEGKAQDEMENIIKEMKEYTDYHFEAEEELLEEHDYPERKLGEQEEQHKKYVNKISEYMKDYEEDKLTLSMDISNFLKDWLSNHILEVDMKYKDHFEGKDL